MNGVTEPLWQAVQEKLSAVLSQFEVFRVTEGLFNRNDIIKERCL
ncbi:MAG: hypothetical protein ACLTW9_30330 [Enterocloster sp.]